LQRKYNIMESMTGMQYKIGNQHKTEDRKRRLQVKTNLVKIHICWKSDQGNNKDIQEHKRKTSVHSK
jgi:hypothetical protein